MFLWSAECQEAFEALKKRLVEAPVLLHPDFATGFVLAMDASYQGLGAVLSQKLEDRQWLSLVEHWLNQRRTMLCSSSGMGH